jgi:hypothetical protein
VSLGASNGPRSCLVATSRWVTDFSICESCCWGCITGRVSAGGEDFQGDVGGMRTACSHSWGCAGETPVRSVSRRRASPRPWRRCVYVCARVCGRATREGMDAVGGERATTWRSAMLVLVTCGRRAWVANTRRKLSRGSCWARASCRFPRGFYFGLERTARVYVCAKSTASIFILVARCIWVVS